VCVAKALTLVPASCADLEQRQHQRRMPHTGSLASPPTRMNPELPRELSTRGTPHEGCLRGLGLGVLQVRWAQEGLSDTNRLDLTCLQIHAVSCSAPRLWATGSYTHAKSDPNTDRSAEDFVHQYCASRFLRSSVVFVERRSGSSAREEPQPQRMRFQWHRPPIMSCAPTRWEDSNSSRRPAPAA